MKNNTKKALSIIIALLAAYNVYLVFDVFFQSPKVLTINPSSINSSEDRYVYIYEAAPGSVIIDSITFDNQTTLEKPISINVVDSVYNPETGFYTYAKSSDEQKEIGKWTTIKDNQNFNLEASKSNQTDFSITLPADLESGSEYRGAILISRNEIKTETNGKKTIYKEAIPIIVYISDNSKEVKYLSEAKKTN